MVQCVTILVIAASYAVALTHVYDTNRLIHTRPPDYHSSSLSHIAHPRSAGQPSIHQHTHPAIDTRTRHSTQTLTQSLIYFPILNQQTPLGESAPRDLHDRSNVVTCTICFNAGTKALAPPTPSLFPGSLGQAKWGEGCECVSLSQRG